jgi:hypothetical protein
MNYRLFLNSLPKQYWIQFKMTTTEIMMAFNNTVRDDKIYTITELKKILTECYNTRTKVKKEKKENKVKKEPTPYNLFVKEHYSEIKTKNPKTTSTEIMKMIAEMWKNKDTDVKQKAEDDKKDIVNNDPDVKQKVEDDKKNQDKEVDKKEDDVKQKVDDKKEDDVKQVKKTVKKVKKEVDTDVKEDVVDGDLPELDKPKKRTVKK